MVDKSTCLKFYKREDIQKAMVEHAQNKELGVRYGDGFGKRPDILMYPNEVLELAKQGVTSFHCSEEVWDNPLAISSDLTRKALDELRAGWDLVLDIDCPDWEISKLTTHLFIKALKDNGIKGISCKFSGNKGFHIGVPFEVFPQEVAGKKTKDIFPEGPKKIAQYLLNIITTRYVQVKNNKIFLNADSAFSLPELKEKFGEQKFLINKCTKCKKEIKKPKETIIEFICPKCEQKVTEDKEFVKCQKCNILMNKIDNTKSLCPCGSNEYNSIFDPLSIIEVDTILISSRHLYRMPYSLHEKSGLASLPIDPDKVLQFEKSMAHPENIQVSTFNFMDRNVLGESGRMLLLNALDFEVKIEEDRETSSDKFEEVKIESPIKEDFFPPCIKQILTNGLEDGKKRAVFILSNFLGKIGWNKKEIESYILKWNREKNRDPLRDNYIVGQMKSFVPGAKLPPNCSNDGYYKDLGVCHPDALCGRLKNPTNYTILRWKRWLRDRENDKDSKNKEDVVEKEAELPKPL
jgi:DNA primase catalytic subunit